MQNKLPKMLCMAEAFYRYDHDPSLRALVLFGRPPKYLGR